MFLKLPTGTPSCLLSPHSEVRATVECKPLSRDLRQLCYRNLEPVRTYHCALSKGLVHTPSLCDRVLG